LCYTLAYQVHRSQTGKRRGGGGVEKLSCKLADSKVFASTK